MKKFIYFLPVLLLLQACSVREKLPRSPREQQKSIVILYENDVHCGIDGYTKLAGLRDAIAKSDTAYAAVVSSGDYLQGAVTGALSRGQYIVDIMSKVGYDAVTIGNHEFDYGAPRMLELLPQIQAPVVCANFFEAGGKNPIFAPYVIRNYGSKRVAFVGICTPDAMLDESYSFYDHVGRLLYDMKTNEAIGLVQQAVDNARAEGADYVVLLSHVGEPPSKLIVDSHKLVADTRGIDVVLDGHSHATIPHDYVNNLDGKPIIITQTGTQFAHIGKLVISRDGRISTSLIPAKDITYTDPKVSFTTDSIKTIMEKEISRKVGTTDYALEINNEKGDRIVRCAETNLGDLVADMHRQYMDAEIGLCNGGGIRNTIPAGVITYGDVTNVLPFDNHMCKIEASGREIVAMLEKCIAIIPEEDGNFPHVSGMRYTIHFVSHTVSDVMVLDASTGEYKPIDLDRKYTIGTNDYYNSGGFYGCLKDCKLLRATSVVNRDAMAEYIEKTLGGTTGDTYAKSQGRITMVAD